MSIFRKIIDSLGLNQEEDMRRIETLKRDIKISKALGEDTSESKKEIRRINRRYTTNTGPR